MQEIKCNNVVIGYTDDPKKVKNFLPDGAPSGYEMLGGTNRNLIYGDDTYTITKSYKKMGNGDGDICTLCRIGVLQNQGGCFVCSVCQAALKCGT